MKTLKYGIDSIYVFLICINIVCEYFCIITKFYQRFFYFSLDNYRSTFECFFDCEFAKNAFYIFFCKHLIQVMHHLQRRILPWGLKQFLYSIIQDQPCRIKQMINIFYLIGPCVYIFNVFDERKCLVLISFHTPTSISREKRIH